MYVKYMVRRRLLQWTLPCIPVIMVLGIAAFSDIRYAFVLLILLLVVYPMTQTMVWIAMAGKPSMIRASRPQRWVANDVGDTFVVEYFHFGCDKENPGEAVEKSTIAYRDVKRAQRGRQHSVLWLRSGDSPLLVIPTEELEIILK